MSPDELNLRTVTLPNGQYLIWMDSSHRIVEIAADTPPCRTKASQCPNYGGHAQAQYVLELGGGEARRLGLRVGQTLEF